MNVSERVRCLAHHRLKKPISYDGDIEHSPDKTLVIVDMQDYFLSDFTYNIIGRMCDLITHARVNGWGIILVEFGGLGDTNITIRKTVDGYEHLATVIKYQENGGLEVVECLQSHPRWSSNLLVCGIFGDACVPATVTGILEQDDSVHIDVVTDLVYPDYVSDCYTLEALDPLNGEPREREIEITSFGLLC